MAYGLWTIDYRQSTAFLTSFAQASALGAGPKTRALQLTAYPTHYLPVLHKPVQEVPFQPRSLV
jgi:hypothetical protein